jgi:hypothetical protein
MIANFMPLRNLLPDQSWIELDLTADGKKGRWNMIGSQNSKHLWRVDWAGTIIEGQSNLWQTGIAIVKKTVMSLEECNLSIQS